MHPNRNDITINYIIKHLLAWIWCCLPACLYLWEHFIASARHWAKMSPCKSTSFEMRKKKQSENTNTPHNEMQYNLFNDYYYYACWSYSLSLKAYSHREKPGNLYCMHCIYASDCCLTITKTHSQLAKQRARMLLEEKWREKRKTESDSCSII